MAANPYQSPQAVSQPSRTYPRRLSFLEIFIVGHVISFFLLLLAPVVASSSVLGEHSGGRYLLGGVVVLFTRLPWLVVLFSLWGGAATAGGAFVVWRARRLIARYAPKP